MIPGRNFPPRRPTRRENVNESIRVREVRAVFPDGTAEVMPTAMALRRAQELGLVDQALGEMEELEAFRLRKVLALLIPGLAELLTSPIPPVVVQ